MHSPILWYCRFYGSVYSHDISINNHCNILNLTKTIPQDPDIHDFLFMYTIIIVLTFTVACLNDAADSTLSDELLKLSSLFNSLILANPLLAKA